MRAREAQLEEGMRGATETLFLRMSIFPVRESAPENLTHRRRSYRIAIDDLH